jgi:hypothetical protein
VAANTLVNCHKYPFVVRIKENVKLDRTRGRKERMKKNGLGKV